MASQHYPPSRMLRQKMKREIALERAAQFRHLPRPTDFAPPAPELPTPPPPAASVHGWQAMPFPPPYTLQYSLTEFEGSHPAFERVFAADSYVVVRRAVPGFVAPPSPPPFDAPEVDVIALVKSEEDRGLVAAMVRRATAALARCRFLVADARAIHPAAIRALAVWCSTAPTLDFVDPRDDVSSRSWWPAT